MARDSEKKPRQNGNGHLYRTQSLRLNRELENRNGELLARLEHKLEGVPANSRPHALAEARGVMESHFDDTSDEHRRNGNIAIDYFLALAAISPGMQVYLPTMREMQRLADEGHISYPGESVIFDPNVFWERALTQALKGAYIRKIDLTVHGIGVKPLTKGFPKEKPVQFGEQNSRNLVGRIHEASNLALATRGWGSALPDRSYALVEFGIHYLRNGASDAEAPETAVHVYTAMDHPFFVLRAEPGDVGRLVGESRFREYNRIYDANRKERESLLTGATRSRNF